MKSTFGCVFLAGFALKSQTIELAPEMPTLKTENLGWLSIGGEATNKIIFHANCRNSVSARLADWILCNSSNGFEPSAFALAPQIQPIVPMFASTRLGNNSDGNFWAQDTTCLEWLHQKPPLSVVYVAFGSFTVFDQKQFHELALGLELSNRPFLWVVREDIGDEGTKNKAYPEGFLDRIKGSKGNIVSGRRSRRF